MKPLVTARKPRTSRPKDLLLYVEDEVENRQVAELRLANKYDILLASNDREACELITEHGSKLTAILMDIQLKGSILDGVQLTRLVRGKLGEDESQLPDYAKKVPVLRVPIIFVTAYGAKYPEDKLKDAGGDQLIPKPVDFTALTSAITRVHLESIRRLTGVPGPA